MDWPSWVECFECTRACCTECRPQSRRAFPPRSHRGFRRGEGRPAASPGPQVPQPGPRGPPSPPGRRERGTGPSETEARRGVRVGRPGPGSGSAPRPSEAGSAMRAAALLPRIEPGTRARAGELGPCFPGGGEEGASPAGRASRSRGEGAGLAPEPFKSARAAGRAGRPHYISRRRSTRRGRPHTPHRALGERPGA